MYSYTIPCLNATKQHLIEGHTSCIRGFVTERRNSPLAFPPLCGPGLWHPRSYNMILGGTEHLGPRESISLAIDINEASDGVATLYLLESQHFLILIPKFLFRKKK